MLGKGVGGGLCSPAIGCQSEHDERRFFCRVHFPELPIKQQTLVPFCERAQPSGWIDDYYWRERERERETRGEGGERGGERGGGGERRMQDRGGGCWWGVAKNVINA